MDAGGAAIVGGAAPDPALEHGLEHALEQGTSPAYLALAERLTRTGILTDPWVEGAPRFRGAPVYVTEGELAAMHEAARAVAAAYDEVCRVVADEPHFLDDFFALTPVQKAMWQASAPAWHALARADVFVTEQGLAICEINSDTPTGEPEAVLLGPLAIEAGAEGADPNVTLETRFLAMLDAVIATLDPALDAEARRTVGVIYPTDLPEDLSLVRLWERWLTGHGLRVVLGSPFNLGALADDTATLLGTPCGVFLRHYKTDWWGERLPVWHDADPFLDPLPLAGPLRILVKAELTGKCAVLNPFGSVLPQNKRSMAFMWEHTDLFSEEARRAIEAYVPETQRLDAVLREQISAEREEWVLKSDYGCEGDEVIVGRDVSQEDWDASLEEAIAERWVVQRYFEAKVGSEGETVNYGVFLIAGEPCGLYARVQWGATTIASLSAPALVRTGLQPVLHPSAEPTR